MKTRKQYLKTDEAKGWFFKKDNKVEIDLQTHQAKKGEDSNP